MSEIAIVGMACRYAEAHSPRELWENVLAQRRSFRRIPRLRLNLAEYSPQQQREDAISVTMAAVLEDYEFDRIRFRVAGDTFLSTDLSHWLALDVAEQALTDAGMPNGSAGQRERTGVFVGNTLAGEFSRANLMRLRWPYVQRVISAALQNGGGKLSDDYVRLLAEIESIYKSPFPATTEDSLAGGLSNTIAGRICNYFDLKGGGYVVDGACASSLLAVANACSALQASDVDVALAGGVDLSLDPFELAGFSKLGALAIDKMRVFDEQSSGFWPGEGCGFVVLMRREEAMAQQHSVRAVIRGWGISSDGSGGITRPELSGQVLALQRAYHRAGYGIDSVAYFEGHGTGTAIGDTVELQALSQVRRSVSNHAPAAAIGSVKANIGHTKAAAGVAGLIKTAMALQAKVLPPNTGCDHPHPELNGEGPALRIMRDGELWPDEAPARAGVSAFGFGGINTHVTLEAADHSDRKSFTGFEQQRLSSAQDCELFLLQASDLDELVVQLDGILPLANEISYAEMTDLAAHLANELDCDQKPLRAACVAATPQELEHAIRVLRDCCASGSTTQMGCSQGVFLGKAGTPPRIGFLFPGQASPVYTEGGIWSRRFSEVRDLYKRAHLPQVRSVDTEVAQPCIATASLAGLLLLRRVGIESNVAVGHSLGELTALCWAGAMDEETLLRVIAERGRLMSQLADPAGSSMASIQAACEDVRRRLNGDPIVVAADNAPTQTVVSGKAFAVKRFVGRLSADGVTATMLPVSHAFHSPLMADPAKAFSRYLTSERLGAVSKTKRIVSTVTGTAIEENTDLCRLLTDQITMPVLFAKSARDMAAEADLVIEVGPGSVLTDIVSRQFDIPAVALNIGSDSLRGLLTAAGAAFALGAPVQAQALFTDRFYRPFDLRHRHKFLQNPCESVPATSFAPVSAPVLPLVAKLLPVVIPPETSTLETLRRLVAQRTQLPFETVLPENRFLDDLHLNSISISQIVLEAAAQSRSVAPVTPAEFTNATLAETAEILERNRHHPTSRGEQKYPAGAESWIRTLGVELVEKPLRIRPSPRIGSSQWQVMAMEQSDFTQWLGRQFESVSGRGVICCVPGVRTGEAAEFLLRSVQSCVNQKVEGVVFVQHGGGAGALARSLFLDHREMTVTVVDVPEASPQIAELVASEARAASGFTEAVYDANRLRREPRLKVLWPERNELARALGIHDLLLVSGGGKGITAECALTLARSSGCRLALLGRSHPERDEELRKNLQRFRNANVVFEYFPADLTDETAAPEAIRRIQSQMGAVTAVLHGAGVNNPKQLEDLTERDLRITLDVKVTALRYILKALDPNNLRLLLAFGSIIGRTGLQGEGHYGLANEWLRMEVEDWQHQHPACRCLNLEWSVWAGVGMGQRLGVLESLQQQGIAPLPLDQALSCLPELLAWETAPASCIVTARTGHLPTLGFGHSDLPFLRFLENVRLHYPGIELIADSEISADTDPYLKDHCFQREQIFPAVLGMEAMAQVAGGLEDTDDVPHFHNLRFNRPIVVSPGKSIVLRVAAVRRRAGAIAVAVRSSTTSFHVDHFTGECIYGAESNGNIEPTVGGLRQRQILPLVPEGDLYGRILFHQGRFCRITAYHELQAKRCVAGTSGTAKQQWFARYLPDDMVLGDAASRDAVIHCVQACIPHKTILPTGVDSVVTSTTWTNESAIVTAEEREQNGDDFIYDIKVEDSEGRICERWNGLRLHAVAPIETQHAWPAALLAPYLERRLSEILPSTDVHISLNEVTANQDSKCSCHRPDGKPEECIVPEIQLSRSHCGSLILTARSQQPVGCDMEQCADRDEASWAGLLNEQWLSVAQLMATEANIPLQGAATQVWALKESLRKCGAAFDQHLQISAQTSDGWTIFLSGELQATTFRTSIQGFQGEVAVAFVTGRRHEVL
jgi:enediyne polyketide synthase